MQQVAGVVVAGVGVVLALWCVMTFAFVGRGTPAPFAPPQRLVIRGPYRFVRNPMYVGVGLTVAGAALFYRSLSLAALGGVFWLAAYLFVVWYEEPTLRRTFGKEYEDYCEQVRRWRPQM